jgi:hypothetical protein
MKTWNKKRVLALVLSVVAFYPCVAEAYVGPGAGITLLGVLWAVIAAIVTAVAGLLIWPIRALWRRARGRTRPQTSGGDAPRNDGAAAGE